MLIITFLFILTMHNICRVHGRFVNVITVQGYLKHLSSTSLNNSLAVNLRFLQISQNQIFEKDFVFATVLISFYAI